MAKPSRLHLNDSFIPAHALLRICEALECGLDDVVQGDIGHAQANMVTDVYGHIMNDDRRRLAQAVDRQFFAQAPIIEAPKKEETTA